MSNDLSRFLASSASASTRARYTAITASQVVNNTTIHVHLPPENPNVKRQKKNNKPIEIDPATFGAIQLSEEVCQMLDPYRSPLTADQKIKFWYPIRIDHTAATYHHAITRAEAYPEQNLSSLPSNYANAVLRAAMAAEDPLDDNFKLIATNLRVLTPSDPDPSQKFFQVLWQFYTRNPIALAAFMSPPDNRIVAAKQWKAFMLPCPICNPCCAALRDRLNTQEIFIPTTPKRKKGEDPTIHDNAVNRYLSIPNLMAHCGTLNDPNPKHTSFVVLHRILAHFYNNLDTGVAPDFQPLYLAIDADFAATQTAEVLDAETQPNPEDDTGA